jgi:hypothetical protein
VKRAPVCRSEALSGTIIWHLEAHLCPDCQKWLFVMLDDASRKVVSVCFLAQLSAKLTTQCLVGMMQEGKQLPLALWTSNAPHFGDEFHAYVAQCGRRHVYNKPGIGGQKRKIHRFLMALVQRPPNTDPVQWANEYNDLPHTKLQEYRDDNGVRHHYTPKQFYAKTPLWPADGGRCQWRVGDKLRQFPIGLEDADPTVIID